MGTSLTKRKLRELRKTCLHGTKTKMVVKFKNDTTHIKETCTICGAYKYVPKSLDNQIETKSTYADSLVTRIEYHLKEIKKLSHFLASMKPRIEKQPHPFYDSEDWREVRYKALKINGRICALCRSTDGVMHVDHIKPRSFHPELALDINNLQILCRPCNLGKSNKDETDFREIKPL